MTGSVEDTYDDLVKALKESKYTKEETLVILAEYTKVLLSNDVPLEQRLSAALTTSNFILRVKNHDWKFAHGFFGNWAKHAEDKKDIDYEIVDDAGC